MARRRSSWDLVLGCALLMTVGLGLAVFTKRGEPRYLLGAAPLLYVAACVGMGVVAEAVRRRLSAHPTLVARAGAPVVLAGTLGALFFGPALLPGRGGFVDANAIPPPVAGERVGSDLRLGLGEQRTLVDIVHREWGWDFALLCRRLHGLVCDAKHGVGSFAALLPAPPVAARDLDVLLEVPGSVMRIPDERRTGTRTMKGAFGRELTFVSFEPPFDAAGIALDRISRAGEPRRCGDGLPFNSSYSTTVASKLYASSTRLDVPWSERPERCRGDDTATYRLWLPVRHPDGRAQVLVGYEGGDATALVQQGTLRRHGADGAGAAESVTVVPGGNEGDLAVIAVTWGRETTALELTLPGDAELKLVDAF